MTLSPLNCGFFYAIKERYLTMPRPTSCTPELTEQARLYLDNYNTVHEHAIPSVVGLVKVLKVARSSIYKWAEEKDNEFSDIVEQINEYQEFDLVDGGLKGNYNPTIAKLILGRHGYSDKQDTNLKGEIDVVEIAVDFGD